MMWIILEQMFDNEEGDKMERNLVAEERKVLDALHLFMRLSPSEQEKVMEMVKRLAEKKQTAEAVCLVP